MLYYNIDEKSWKVIPKILKSWHIKGKDLYLNANCKERITVVAGVRADGLRLPLQLIATGETEKFLDTQIGDINYHFKTLVKTVGQRKKLLKIILLAYAIIIIFQKKHYI